MESEKEVKLFNEDETLKRGMKSRHLAMIAIGCTIGSTLFLGLGDIVRTAGPFGATLAFVIGGIIMLLALLSLSEMAVAMPISGSFQAYASKFISPFAGYATGWLYWLNWGTSATAALVAASILMRNWYPGIAEWIWCVGIAVILCVINMLSSKAFGEAEFWFAGIKVVAIVIFIAIGGAVLFGIWPVVGQDIVGFSAFSKDGYFPNGLFPVFLTMILVVCSFQGAELVGIAAGESENAEKNVPKAIKNVGVRILLFYILATIVVACIVPYKDANVSVSPFAQVFSIIGIPYATDVMNFVIITSCLSSINSALYACSRLLWSMARERLAPAFLGKVNESGVPFNGVLLTAGLMMVALLVKVFGAEQLFIMMLAASGLIGCLIWIIISWSQIGFRNYLKRQGGSVRQLKFKTWFYPLVPVAGIVANIVIVCGMWFDESLRVVLYSGGACVALITVSYFAIVKARRKTVKG